jgi:hypothetical protein
LRVRLLPQAYACWPCGSLDRDLRTLRKSSSDADIAQKFLHYLPTLSRPLVHPRPRLETRFPALGPHSRYAYRTQERRVCVRRPREGSIGLVLCAADKSIAHVRVEPIVPSDAGSRFPGQFCRTWLFQVCFFTKPIACGSDVTARYAVGDSHDGCECR